MTPLDFNSGTTTQFPLQQMGSHDHHHHHHSCNTGLSLGLASFKHTTNKQQPSTTTATLVSLKFDQVLPALSLGPSDQVSSSHSNENNNNNSVEMEKVVNSMRRHSDEEEDDDEEAGPRKKLRLTKDQSAVLEGIFKEHATLNPNQKQALAKQLNLQPRQVEVWFQNRRARTKLKQTEMDCELLKKCCERLSEENKRLHKELKELKSLKLAAATPLMYTPMSAATLSLCPSCEISNGSAVIKSKSQVPGVHRHQKPAFLSNTSMKLATKRTPQFFPHSSAAC